MKAALDFVLQYEGGFVNHPDDPGGATKYGVSLRYLSGLGEDGDLNGDGRVDIEDIRGLSVDDARELYRIRFWMPLLCDDLPEALAVAVCDTAVNLGTGRAARLLQRVAGVAEDGIIGQKTLAAAAQGGPDMLASFLSLRRSHYLRIIGKNPRLASFARGWDNRVRELESLCRGL